MLELMDAFQAEIDAGPAWVALWVNFMGAVFALAVPFAFFRLEARVAILVIALTVPTMIFVFGQIGYVRLLGLVHVILWTPFLIFLLSRRKDWNVRETLAGKWILLLTLTITVSLAFDYADVVRYIAGERAPMNG